MTVMLNIARNSSKVVPPCNQGIIKTLKNFCCRQMQSRILNLLDESENISAGDLAKVSLPWENLFGNNIKHCIKHAGFSKESSKILVADENVEFYEAKFL